MISSDQIRSDAVFAHAIRYSRLPLCITDPSKPDEPIVFANPAFCELTGYDEDEFIGKNCRFLQGPETTAESVKQIRQAIASNEVTMIEIVNYRKSGEKFINALQMGPVFDSAGQLVYRFGSQMDITAEKERERALAALKSEELLHRLKNIINVMTVVIEMTGRTATDTVSYSRKIADRLRVLGEAHFSTLSTDKPVVLHLEELARSLLDAYAPFGPEQTQITGAKVNLPEQCLTTITLLLHELATNAVKHGSLGVEGGVVALGWDMKEDGTLHMTWTEHNGPEVNVPTRENGSKIVRTLINVSGGTLTYDWQKSGLTAELILPHVGRGPQV